MAPSFPRAMEDQVGVSSGTGSKQFEIQINAEYPQQRVSIGALSRGRSSSHDFVLLVGRINALWMAASFTPLFGFVRNPSDAPSPQPKALPTFAIDMSLAVCVLK